MRVQCPLNKQKYIGIALEMLVTVYVIVTVNVVVLTQVWYYMSYDPFDALCNRYNHRYPPCFWSFIVITTLIFRHLEWFIFWSLLSISWKVRFSTMPSGFYRVNHYDRIEALHDRQCHCRWTSYFYYFYSSPLFSMFVVVPVHLRCAHFTELNIGRG